MIRPLNSNIIITPIERSETTKSGIFIPTSADEQEVKRGKIVEVADNITDLEVDMVVLYKKYSPDILKVNDIEYLTVHHDDILAIVDEDNNQRVSIAKDYEKDTLQPDNPKFDKAYPGAPKTVDKIRKK